MPIKSSPKAAGTQRKPKAKTETGAEVRKSAAPVSKPKITTFKEREARERAQTAPPLVKVKKAPAKKADPAEPKKRGRGRPKTGFDKLSYQREYMREYRAKRKGAKK